MSYEYPEPTLEPKVKFRCFRHGATSISSDRRRPDRNHRASEDRARRHSASNVIIIVIVMILSAGVLADMVYRLATTELASETTNYAAAAAVVAALFTSLLNGRGLYKPMVLLAWTSQVPSRYAHLDRRLCSWLAAFSHRRSGARFLAARSFLSLQSVSLAWSLTGRFGV